MSPPPTSASAPAAADDGEPPSPSQSSTSNHQLIFKKHKILPHPRKDASYAGLRGSRPYGPPKSQGPAPAIFTASLSAGALSDEACITNSQPSSPRTNKQYPKTLINGPDLPPTPPAHSRNSSSTYSVQPSSATYVQSPERSAEDVQLKPQLPTTPTKQLSPPTPDVTPPHAAQHELRPRGPALRPPLRDRNLSKATTDSRTESFKTARENPSSSSSDNEDSSMSLQPALVSERILERTVHRPSIESKNQPKKRQPKVVGLGLGLESSPEESITPKSKREFVTFDGQWGSSNEEVAKEWDDNLQRNVVVRSQQNSTRNAKGSNPRDEVIEDLTVSPTNATKALRSMSLPQRILTFPSPVESIDKPKTQEKSPSPTQEQQQQQQQQQQRQRQQRQQQQQQQQRRVLSQPSQNREMPLSSAAPVVAQMAASSNSSMSDKSPQVSTASSRSTASASAETAVAGSPLQRKRTLRHVKKKDVLRDSGLDLSEPSSAAAPSPHEETNRLQHPNGGRLNSNAHDSVVSAASINSISSRSARREIWKAGGIPVVVVPGRISSARSASREPSLRSTSSRRSKQSQSQHFAPPSQVAKSQEVSPYVDKHSRRGRAYSVSEESRNSSALDGSALGDQRTIDFPPTIPKRSSSLSAPTSRNVSRSGSMTAESVHAQSAFLKSRSNDQDKPPQDLARCELSPGQAPRIVSDDKQPPLQKTITRPETLASELEARQCADAILIRGAVNNHGSSPDGLAGKNENVQQFNQNDVYRNDDNDNNDDHNNFLDPRSSLDRHVDRNRARNLSPHNTPFSMVSVETCTTHHSHAVVSEALAVSIYPHQNTSVLVVDHSTRPSNSSDDSHLERLTDPTGISTPKEESSPAFLFTTLFAPSSISAPPPEQPTVLNTFPGAKEDKPVTPSHQQLFPLDNVDSPLRNPRAPPEPPAINFIPATPSGLTPATVRDLQRGNYFDETRDGQPRRRRSVSTVLRRALSRGRSTTKDYGPSASRSGGLLTRTLSLTRDVHRKSTSTRRSDSVGRSRHRSFDMKPAEEDRLHPFWRPTSFYQTDDDDYDDEDEDEETYRYPPIDNRPRGPRRSLSMRMKRTFAILPLEHRDDYYPATSGDGPERRTVRRTPSGNLRVVKHHSSSESLGEHGTPEHLRPYTAPERHGSRKFWFWRSPSLTRANTSQLRSHDPVEDDSAARYQHDTTVNAGGEKKAIKILPNLGLGGKIGEYGPQTIPRRFSERRREKRSNELRQMISGPQEVRDGVGEVIRRTNYRDAFTQAQVG